MESNNEKIHIEKNSVIYEQLKEATKAYSNYTTVEEFIRKEQNSHLYPCDALAVLCGKITVDEKEEIWIEFFQGKKEDLGLVYGGKGNHAYIFQNLDINKLKGLAMSQSKQEIVQDKHCQISCKKTNEGKQSIRIDFPAGNHITFYDDGYCKGKNGVSIHRFATIPQEKDGYIIHSIGNDNNEIKISYRQQKSNIKPSIRITNKKGDGICVYPDLYVNPVSNNKTNADKGEEIDCNIFEFIRNHLFGQERSNQTKYLRKPAEKTLYSLNEAHEFKIGL